MNSKNISDTRHTVKQLASAIAAFAVVGACSSQQDSSLFSDVSANALGGSNGEASVGGAGAVLGMPASAGGSGGGLRAPAFGGNGARSDSLGGSAAVVTAFGGGPATSGETSSFGGGTASAGGAAAASGGVSTSCGSADSSCGSADAGGGSTDASGGAHLGTGGGHSGGAMAAGGTGGGHSGGAMATGGTGGAAACVPAAERCDGRDENCTKGLTDEVCPSDCVGKSYGSHGYMFCVLDGNRAEANTRCSQSSLYLLEINSAEENSWVRRTATDLGIGSLWLGARDAVEGEWRWVSTTQFWQGVAAPGGAPVAGRYSNWSTGQPNNSGGNQDCARMGSDGFWDDTDCTGSTSGGECQNFCVT